MDWRDKIVEHETPSGKINRVKIKSLPPEEQERYKPKKEKKEVVKKPKPKKLTEEELEAKLRARDTFGVAKKDSDKQELINLIDKNSTYHEIVERAAFSLGSIKDNILQASANKVKDVVKSDFIKKSWQNSSTTTESIVLMSVVSSLKLSESKQIIDDEDLLSIFGEERFKKLKKGVQDIYEETQNFYKKKNIKQVKIFRGVKQVYLTNRPMESWTSDKSLAKKFGDTIKSENVDVSKIFCDLRHDEVFNSRDEKELIKLTNLVSMMKIAKFLK